MAMKPCNACQENNWGDFKEVDGYVIATCQQCGNEVEFLSKKARKQQERIKLPEYQIMEKLDRIITLLETITDNTAL